MAVTIFGKNYSKISCVGDLRLILFFPSLHERFGICWKPFWPTSYGVTSHSDPGVLALAQLFLPHKPGSPLQKPLWQEEAA